MKDVSKYLMGFRDVAKDWFESHSHWHEAHEFIQAFFKKEKLETLDWEDVKCLADQIHALNKLTVAKRRAFGQMNHELEFYRTSFQFLAHGPGELRDRVRDFVQNPSHRLRYVNESTLAELLAQAFPGQFVNMHVRSEFALDFLGIDVPTTTNFVDRFFAFQDAVKPIVAEYKRVVGRRTELPLNLEIDQFLTYVHQTYGGANDARIENQMEPGRRYWLLGAGMTGELWGEFERGNMIAIGWDELGDLGKYANKDEITEALSRHGSSDAGPAADAVTCYQFAHEMSPGDYVIVKAGTKKVLALGEVLSEYRLDGSRERHRHVHDVRWLIVGDWRFSDDGAQMIAKLLTDVTPYARHVNRLLNMIQGSDTLEVASVPDDQRGYWWLNCNPYVWDPRGIAIGQPLPYPSHGDEAVRRKMRDLMSQLKAGDQMLGYMTSPHRQVACLLEVTKGLHKYGSGETFEFKKLFDLGGEQSRESLKLKPALVNAEPLINNNGVLYPLTKDEFEVIRGLVSIKVSSRAATGARKVAAPFSKSDALKELFLGDQEFQRLIELLEYKKNVIVEGPPGVGKTLVARHLAQVGMGAKAKDQLAMVQLHPSFKYEDFIQGVRPAGDGRWITKNGVFFEFCQNARDNLDKKYFFVIDEINRGELGKVFGEVMTLLEPDKRGPEHALTLTHAKDADERFYVPPNVYVIGTMNTAEREVRRVDLALRRRFGFFALPPAFGSPRFSEFLLARGASPELVDKIVTQMARLNQRISADTVNLGPGFRIGHSYFCPPDRTTQLDERWYRSVLEHEVKPLLRGYGGQAPLWLEEEIDRIAG